MSDIRQAARLARSEGVQVTWRRDGSILIAPAPRHAAMLATSKAGDDRNSKRRTIPVELSQIIRTPRSQTVPTIQVLAFLPPSIHCSCAEVGRRRARAASSSEVADTPPEVGLMP